MAQSSFHLPLIPHQSRNNKKQIMSILYLFKKASIATVGAAFISVVAVSVKPAQAANLLYFNDYNIGVDAMGQALADSGNQLMIATSTNNFKTLINSGSYDVGIFFTQLNLASSYSSAINALGSFVQKGGKSIYTDWSMNTSLATQFGAGFTRTANFSQVSLTDSEYASGTYNLSNPGWGTYSMGLTALPGSSVVAKAENNDAAVVVGNEGRSVTFGFLADTFADTAQGKALFASFLRKLTSPVTVQCSIN